MKLGEIMYKAQQEEAASTEDIQPDSDPQGQTDDDGTIVDADFEEVEDEERKDKSA